VTPLVRWRGTTWWCRPGGTWLEHPSRPRQRSLLPLLLDTSVASILLLNRGAHKLVHGAASKKHQLLMKHRVEPLRKQRHLLLIGVRLVGAIL
jgi:hypothetical protein